MKSSLIVFCLLTLVSCGKRTVTKTNTVTIHPADTRMSCNVYEVIGSSSLPDFSSLSSLGEIKVSELNNANTNTSSSFKSLLGTPHESLVEQFGLNCNGEFVAKESGSYILYLNSDDGSSLSLNGISLISNNDGLHSMAKKSISVFLVKDQSYSINVKYFQNFGEKGLILSMKRPLSSLEEVIRF